MQWFLWCTHGASVARYHRLVTNYTTLQRAAAATANSSRKYMQSVVLRASSSYGDCVGLSLSRLRLSTRRLLAARKRFTESFRRPRLNPLMGISELHRNGPLYINTVIGSLHWPLMGGLLHLVQRGGAWAGCGPAQSPHHCTKRNNPPINDRCTNFTFDATL